MTLPIGIKTQFWDTAGPNLEETGISYHTKEFVLMRSISGTPTLSNLGPANRLIKP